LESFAKRVHELVGWHAELYIDSKSLSEISQTVSNLPAVSIDHLGLSDEGFSTLLSLVDKGVRVKATGFGRVTLNVVQAIRALSSVNPKALMFGTDLPSTRAKRPFEASDLDTLLEALGDSNLAEKVLYRNALEWYRIEM
jgi:predicted TIM-barrel fold metal-dependent hydrolase